MTTKPESPRPTFLGRRPTILATSAAALLALGLVPYTARGQTWVANARSGSWNTPTNWTPIGVPNSGTATATFGASNRTSVVVLQNTTVNTIVFNSNATSSYTITAAPSDPVDGAFGLNISGTGITNNSGTLQKFVTAVDGSGDSGFISFYNNATAGRLTQYTNVGSSTASAFGGTVYFNYTATAGSATFINQAATVNGAFSGSILFGDHSTAGNATITNQGATVNGAQGGETAFEDNATAGNATITTNGGSNGAAGGETVFSDDSDGGTARAITNGNGTFDISGIADGGMNIGSIEGSGTYLLGSNTLTVGGNSRSTTVSGVIADGGVHNNAGGSLVKTGTGTLILTGVNTYTGTTSVNAGTLQIGNGTSGSLASTAAVTLSGTGILATDLATGSTFSNDIDLTTSTTAVKAIQSAGNTNTLSGLISGSGAFDQNGTGVTILTQTETYTGPTAVKAGTLEIGNGATGNLASASAVSVASASTLELNLKDGTNFSNSVNNKGHFLATGATGAYLVSSTIAGTGNFTKTGGSTVALTGANTYQGGTVISGGTLLVNNSTGSGTGTGPVTVNNGATLGGSGKTAGAVTLKHGGTIAPGAGSPGTAGTILHGSSLMWNGGGTLVLQLGPTADELVLTGALTEGTAGAYTLDLLNVDITQSTYTLARFASTTFAAKDFTLELPAGYTGTLVETKTSLTVDLSTVGLEDNPNTGDSDGAATLTVAGDSGGVPVQSIDGSGPDFSGLASGAPANLGIVPAPEPGSAALLALGAGALLGWRRRRI